MQKIMKKLTYKHIKTSMPRILVQDILGHLLIFSVMSINFLWKMRPTKSVTNWILFFARLKLVARVLSCVGVITGIKWRRLVCVVLRCCQTFFMQRQICMWVCFQQKMFVDLQLISIAVCVWIETVCWSSAHIHCNVRMNLKCMYVVNQVHSYWSQFTICSLIKIIYNIEISPFNYKICIILWCPKFYYQYHNNYCSNNIDIKRLQTQFICFFFQYGMILVLLDMSIFDLRKHNLMWRDLRFVLVFMHN